MKLLADMARLMVRGGNLFSHCSSVPGEDTLRHPETLVTLSQVSTVS